MWGMCVLMMEMLGRDGIVRELDWVSAGDFCELLAYLEFGL